MTAILLDTGEVMATGDDWAGGLGVDKQPRVDQNKLVSTHMLHKL